MVIQKRDEGILKWVLLRSSSKLEYRYSLFWKLGRIRRIHLNAYRGSFWCRPTQHMHLLRILFTIIGIREGCWLDVDIFSQALLCEIYPLTSKKMSLILLCLHIIVFCERTTKISILRENAFDTPLKCTTCILSTVSDFGVGHIAEGILGYVMILRDSQAKATVTAVVLGFTLNRENTKR